MDNRKWSRFYKDIVHSPNSRGCIPQGVIRKNHCIVAYGAEGIPLYFRVFPKKRHRIVHHGKTQTRGSKLKRQLCGMCFVDDIGRYIIRGKNGVRNLPQIVSLPKNNKRFFQDFIQRKIRIPTSLPGFRKTAVVEFGRGINDNLFLKQPCIGEAEVIGKTYDGEINFTGLQHFSKLQVGALRNLQINLRILLLQRKQKFGD